MEESIHTLPARASKAIGLVTTVALVTVTRLELIRQLEYWIGGMIADSDLSDQ